LGAAVPQLGVAVPQYIVGAAAQHTQERLAASAAKHNLLQIEQIMDIDHCNADACSTVPTPVSTKACATCGRHLTRTHCWVMHPLLDPPAQHIGVVMPQYTVAVMPRRTVGGSLCPCQRACSCLAGCVMLLRAKLHVKSTISKVRPLTVVYVMEYVAAITVSAM